MGDKLLSTELIESHTKEDVIFIFNELRKASVIWDGRKEVLKASRRKVFVRRAKNGNAVYKYQWQCAKCKKWYKNESDVEVDHIEEIGGITGFTGDWSVVIRKMFPRPVLDHLQVLCVSCHKRKTREFMAACFKYERKKRE